MKSNHSSEPRAPFEEIIVEVPDTEASHHSDHWGIFFRDPRQVLTLIPQIAQKGFEAITHATIRSSKPYPFPDDEPEGRLLMWPIPRFGLIAIIGRNKPQEPNKLVSLYPWVSEGVQHTIRLEQVHLWPNRLEAQVEAIVGEEMSITFFDPHFVTSRVFYKRDEIYQFIIVGFPYLFEIIDPEPITINNPEIAKVLWNSTDDPEFRDSEEPIVVSTANMAMLLPRDDLAIDDYEFQGPVKSVKEFQLEILGQRCWKIRVTVARPSDTDFDVDLCVTPEVLGEGRLPDVGEVVRGVLWLQGYLWMPGSGD